MKKEEQKTDFNRQEHIKIFVDKFNHDVETRGRFFRFLLSLDQMFNVLLWNGSQDETISSHIGRRIAEDRATKFDKIVCCFLRKIEASHCKESLAE